MGFSIKRLDKYFRWVRNLSSSYNENLVIGKDYAKYCRMETVCSLIGDKTNERKWAERKHLWISRYIRESIPETLKKYQGCTSPDNLFDPQSEVKVWSMWWQGEENAGELFRMCIASARKHIPYPVVVLDKVNYAKYIDLPEYVIQKHNEGKVRIQHMCDLMFASILAQQGGFFTGATVYWTQDAEEDLLRAPFFTPRAVDWDTTAVSKFRWTGYLMAGNKEFPLFQFARDALLEYWKNRDAAVDYLLLDYIFDIAYSDIPCVKVLIDSLPEKNNMLRNELIGHLSDPYDEELFRRYTFGDTKFYKLSWKFGKKEKITETNQMTNYGHMLDELGIQERR